MVVLAVLSVVVVPGTGVRGPGDAVAAGLRARPGAESGTDAGRPAGRGLAWSTVLGGGGHDGAEAVAVDGEGYVYVTGRTESGTLPTTAGAFDRTYNWGGDVFVAKLSPDGSTLEYATYLGGIGVDEGYGIAVDRAGRAYVTGRTLSWDFPTTPGSAGRRLVGYADVFVARLSSDGSDLEYSALVGGIDLDQAQAVALDAEGRAHVTGFTYSPDFPVTPGAFDTQPDGGEAFVVRLSPDGSALDYATFLGGEPESDDDTATDEDNARAIAVDRRGRATVTGYTRAADFPTTPGAYDRTFGGDGDVYVVRLTRDGSALVYSTFLGGSSVDDAGGLAVDPQGRAYVTGYTDSLDFPISRGAVDRSRDGDWGDAFVAVLDRDGSRLRRATYLGGVGFDWGQDIAVGRGGGVYVSGHTDSLDFPTTRWSAPPRPGAEAFLARLSPGLSSLGFSTVVGGSADDYGLGFALGRRGAGHVVGRTYSDDFPVTPGAPGSVYRGASEAFVAQVRAG